MSRCVDRVCVLEGVLECGCVGVVVLVCGCVGGCVRGRVGVSPRTTSRTEQKVRYSFSFICRTKMMRRSSGDREGPEEEGEEDKGAFDAAADDDDDDDDDVVDDDDDDDVVDVADDDDVRLPQYLLSPSLISPPSPRADANLECVRVVIGGVNRVG